MCQWKCDTPYAHICWGEVAGERFNYNPMEGAVDGAYFGKSPTGWIKTELFYGWIANHFAKHVKQRPVVLLIDGHSTHIDIETSKFCKENDIFLYCLPPHSSHITQPLDVGFFGPLKSNWKIAVAKYRQDHIGDSLSKKQFASVFKEAWIDTIKPRTIINAFVATGIYPIDKSKIKSIKTAPSKVYSYEEESAINPSFIALNALEAQMDTATLKKLERFLENYDVADDVLYTTWVK